MKKKWIISIVVLLAAVAAVLGFMNRQNSPKDEGILLQSSRSTAAVAFEKLDQITFEGNLVNGKGEVSHHEYKGVELNALLEANRITVTETSILTATSEKRSADHRLQCQPSEADQGGQHHLCCLLHHQLPRSHGQGSE